MEHNSWAKRAIGAGETPESLWEACCSYFDWCDTNPIIVKEVIRGGRGASTIVNVEKTRPYTLDGLCLHVGITMSYIKSIRDKNDNLFSLVVERALMVISTQNKEYAMVGIFNPILVGKVHKIGESDDSSGYAPVININVIGVNEVPKMLSDENDFSESEENIKTENPTEQVGNSEN